MLVMTQGRPGSGRLLDTGRPGSGRLRDTGRPSSGRRMEHASFVDELSAVSTALLRVKAAHASEMEKLAKENAALRTQLSVLPNQVEDDELESVKAKLPPDCEPGVCIARQVSPPKEPLVNVSRLNPKPGVHFLDDLPEGRYDVLRKSSENRGDLLRQSALHIGKTSNVVKALRHSSRRGPESETELDSPTSPSSTVDGRLAHIANGRGVDTETELDSPMSPLSTASGRLVRIANGQSPSPRPPTSLLQVPSTKSPTSKLQVRDIWQGESEALEDFSSVVSFRILYKDGLQSPVPQRRIHSLRSEGSCLDLDEKRGALAPMKCCQVARMLCSTMALHPAGHVRTFWNLMCLCFILYDLVVLPLHAFNVGDEDGVQVCDWLITIWWTVDVFMTFRTGYYVGPRLEMRHRQIAIHYAKTWLVCDCAIVVIEWMSRFAHTVSSASILRSSRVLRSLRFLRLIRVPKLKVFVEDVREHLSSNLYMLCGTMIGLSLVLLLTIHIITCVWYAFGCGVSDGWVTYDAYEGHKGTFFWYIASARWVISQLNGRTDMDERRNLRERLFTCIVGVALAVIAQAVFISFITKCMLDLSNLLSGKTRLRRCVNDYLRTNPLPPDLVTRVKQCLKEYYDINHEADTEEQVLKLLPKHVQTDVLYEIRAPVIARHNFYHGLLFESPSTMRYICRSVVQTISARRSEVVFSPGDDCNRMLFTDKLSATYSQFSNEKVFTQRGSTERRNILSTATQISKVSLNTLNDPAENKLKKVTPDSWISEAALWTDWKNRGNFTTTAHGFLYGVLCSDLARALKKHAQAYVTATLYARHLIDELKHNEVLSDILAFEVQLIPPIQLRVTVVGANDLYNADGFMSGKSDPYCLCKAVGLLSTCSETRFRTSTIANNLDPVWNHTAEVGLTRHQSLRFEVWDDDFSPQADTLLGEAGIGAEDFCPDGFEGELILGGGAGSQGSLKVKIEVLQLEKDALF